MPTPENSIQPSASQGPEAQGVEAAPRNPGEVWNQLKQDQASGNIPGVLQGVRTLDQTLFPAPTPEDPRRRIPLTETPQVESYLKTAVAPTRAVRETLRQQFENAYNSDDPVSQAAQEDCQRLLKVLGIDPFELLDLQIEENQATEGTQPATAAATATDLPAQPVKKRRSLFHPFGGGHKTPTGQPDREVNTTPAQPAPERGTIKETETEVEIGMEDLLKADANLYANKNNLLSPAALRDLQSAWNKLQQEHPDQITGYIQNNHPLVLQNTILKQSKGEISKLVRKTRQDLTQEEIEPSLIDDPLAILRVDYELMHQTSGGARDVLRNTAAKLDTLLVQQELGVNPFLALETGEKMLKTGGPYAGQLSTETTKELLKAMQAISREQVETHLAQHPKDILKFTPANLSYLNPDARKALVQIARKLRFKFAEGPTTTTALGAAETPTAAAQTEAGNIQIEAVSGTLTDAQIHQKLADITAKAHDQIGKGQNVDVVKNSVIEDLKTGLNLSDEAQIASLAKLTMWRAELKTPAQGQEKWVVLSIPPGVALEEHTGDRTDYHRKRARIIQVHANLITVWSPDTKKTFQVQYSEVFEDGTVIQTEAPKPSSEESEVAGEATPANSRLAQLLEERKSIENLSISDEAKRIPLAEIEEKIRQEEAAQAEDSTNVSQLYFRTLRGILDSSNLTDAQKVEMVGKVQAAVAQTNAIIAESQARLQGQQGGETNPQPAGATTESATIVDKTKVPEIVSESNFGKTVKATLPSGKPGETAVYQGTIKGIETRFGEPQYVIQLDNNTLRTARPENMEFLEQRAEERTLTPERQTLENGALQQGQALAGETGAPLTEEDLQKFRQSQEGKQG